MVNGSGNVRVAYSAKSAGTSFRRVRSPEAPKMTSENGSSAYGMAPELVAERGEQPVREGVVHQEALREEGSSDAAARSRIQSRRPSTGLTIAAGSPLERSPSAAFTTLAFSAPDTR